jgi:hypothetical protein
VENARRVARTMPRDRICTGPIDFPRRFGIHADRDQFRPTVSFSSCRRIAFAVATSLAMLLVFLPTSVSAIRAVIQQQSTNTSSEETHEEHVKKEKEDQKGRPERVVREPGLVLASAAITQPPRERVALRSVASPPHPSQFSVRRLL